jgi:hypothetical protein
MKIDIKRLHKREHSIIGELTIDGVWQCYTLENIERDIKIESETAIPRGNYKIIINQSNRFKKLLPLLLDVPGFEGVRLIGEHTNHNTDGCILVGKTRSKDFISQSRKAFDKLFDKMKKAKEITITIG